MKTVLCVLSFLGLCVDPAAAQAPRVDSVVNGASFLSSLSPGAGVSIFGANLSGANLTVMVAGTNVPVLFSSATQVNVHFPLSLPLGPANLILSHAGGTSAPVPITLQAYAPAFFRNFSVPGLIAAFSGNRPITPSNPAHGGDLIKALVNGLGQTNPAAPPAGSTIPPTPEFKTQLTPAITVGSIPATVTLSKLFPGPQAFIYEVSFVVPPLTPAGNQTPIVSIGGFSSPSSVLLNGVPVPVILPIGCRDITSQVRVTRGSFVFNRRLNRYVQSIQVQALSPSNFPANATLMLTGLTSGVTLSNPSSPVCSPSDGSANTGLTFNTQALQSASTTLQFANPQHLGITYGVRVLVP